MTAMTPKALDRSEFYRPPTTAVVPARLAVMVALGLALVMGLAADIASAPETIHLKEVVVEPLRCGTNLLSNPSFEEVGPAGILAGWQWDRRNTVAVAVTDRTQAHRGRQSLFITNGTSFGAQVYGTLWRTQPVRLVAGSDAAVASLRRFKGRLVFIGEGDLLTRDEFGRPRASSLPAERINFRHGATSARELHAQLTARLPAWNLHPALELRGADQQPAWGVEWRSAETHDGMVVNLCNYRREPATVTFSQRERLASAHDVLTGDQVGSSLTLSPLEVRLLRVAPGTKSSP